MSDIRFNQWLHNSGTGGVSQVDGGHVGIGTTNPEIAVHSGNNKILNVGIVTASTYYGDGSNLTGITDNVVNINNNADNKIITGSGSANTLEAEATLTYSNNGSAAMLNVKRSNTSGQEAILYYDANYLDIETREATGIRLKTNTADRLIINADGKIGVSRVATQHPFEIGHASSPTQSFWRGSTKGFAISAESAATYLMSYQDVPLIFSVSSGSSYTEILRINSNSSMQHTRSDNVQRFDLEFRNTGGISDGNYGGILWTQGASGATHLASLRIAYADTGQPDIVFGTRQSGGNSLTDALRIHKNGDLSLPVVGSKIYTNNSGSNLTIQGGASYPGSAIKFNGGTNGGTGVMHFYAGQSSSLQERMILTAGGQLCIGTSTAVRALTIKDPGQIHVESTNTGNWVGMSIKGSSGTNNYNAYFGVLDSSGKFFVDNGSNGDDIIIESSASGQKQGRVLVGPSVPTSGDDSQVIIRNNESQGIYRCLRLNNQSNNNRITMTFEGGGTQTGDIRLNGSTTSYNSYSDYRLKENVVPLTDPIMRLKTLKPYRFNFIASPDITLDGFFAHEVSPAVAEAVGGEKDDVDTDGNVVPQALDMAKLVPLLTASLQEAITKIETLEAEVAALKGS